MLRGLIFLLVVLVPALAGRAQEPPPGSVPAQPAEEVEAVAQAVIQEVNEFYSEYWKAWEERDVEAVAARLAEDFAGMVYVEDRGVVRFGKDSEVEGIRRFFRALGDRDAAWSRRLLAVVPRTRTEAVAAVRNDFNLGPRGGEVELTIEVVRKQPDGGWLLVRKYTEKSRWQEARGF